MRKLNGHFFGLESVRAKVSHLNDVDVLLILSGDNFGDFFLVGDVGAASHW